MTIASDLLKLKDLIYTFAISVFCEDSSIGLYGCRVQSHNYIVLPVFQADLNGNICIRSHTLWNRHLRYDTLTTSQTYTRALRSGDVKYYLLLLLDRLKLFQLLRIF